MDENNIRRVYMISEYLGIESDYVIIAEILVDMALIAMNEKSRLNAIVEKYSLHLDEIEYKVKEINRIILE